MARGGEGGLGLGLGARFALAMGGALLVVGAGSGFLVYQGALRATEGQDQRLVQAILELNARALGPAWSNPRLAVDAFADPETAPAPSRDPDPDALLRGLWDRRDRRAEQRSPTLRLFTVTGPDGNPVQLWELRRPSREDVSHVLLVPRLEREKNAELLQLVVAVTAVTVLVGVGVSMLVASRVAQPLQGVVAGVRQIGSGNPRYRSRARGGREIALLERAISRMTHELEAAREAEVELSVREREIELAGGVREALVPMTTPLVEGFDVGAAHLPGALLGGSFHDFVEHADGRLGLLVCDVSASGVPAALVGAMARGYLRSNLLDNDDVGVALRAVNRELARDVKRGMFVTALYAEVDPGGGSARVACAGHRLPLLRWTAGDGKLRTFQPEGIALGLDRGPVFDRALTVQQLEVAPGDRLVLANAAAAALEGEDGEELGEKRLYQRVVANAPQGTTRFLKALRAELEHFHGDEAFPQDVSIVTLLRET